MKYADEEIEKFQLKINSLQMLLLQFMVKEYLQITFMILCVVM